MALWAISDLHLAFNQDKPMDIFGQNWEKHEEKIRNNWVEKIKEEDTIIIAGDISWSINIEEGFEDLKWVHSLPGEKIMVRGNHDYWWQGINKLNSLYGNMKFIQNNFFAYEDYAICGTRGWILPNNSNFTEHDKKIYARECIRLKLSLDSAVKKGYTKIIVATHYPPIYEGNEKNEVLDILHEYGVETVLYGHLHGPSLKKAFNGVKDDIKYIMTSSDYLDFNPILIK